MTGRIKARRFCGQTLFSPSCTGLLQSNNWHPLLETKAKPAPSSANISTPMVLMKVQFLGSLQIFICPET